MTRAVILTLGLLLTGLAGVHPSYTASAQGAAAWTTLFDGKSLKGFSNSATESALVIVDANGRERIDIPRDRVVAFYGLLGGYGGVKKGASKGAEALHTGSRDKLPGLVFAGVGALVGLAKSDGRPVLIYSK